MTAQEAMRAVSIVRAMRSMHGDSRVARRLEVDLCCEVLETWDSKGEQIFPTLPNDCVRRICLGILANRPFEGFHPWRLP
jgi:hypothetical protein